MLNSTPTIKAFYYNNAHIKIYLSHEPGLYIVEGVLMGQLTRALTCDADLWCDCLDEAHPDKALLARRMLFRLLRYRLTAAQPVNAFKWRYFNRIR